MARDRSGGAVTKRPLRAVSQLDGAEHRSGLRLLTRDEHRTLVRRLGQHLPLLVGTGRLWVGRDGELRIIERHIHGQLVVGYAYVRGRVREATIVLPDTAPILLVTIAEQAAA